MTAPDVDALEAARAAATELRHRLVGGSNEGVDCSCGWFGPGSEYETHVTAAIGDTLAPLLAATRERDALRAAVEGLAEELRKRGKKRMADSRAQANVALAKQLRSGALARLADASLLSALLAAVDGGGQ